MKSETLATQLLSCTDALANSERSGNKDWASKWKLRLIGLQKLLPSGSGIDAGTKLVSVTETTIKLDCSFHHMNDAGMYDGWTQHRITVTATFGGYKVTVGGRNRNQIKDYLCDVYRDAMEANYVWSDIQGRWLDMERAS